MRITRNGGGKVISFPAFEEGSRLEELAQRIAHALDTTPCQAKGSALELLIGFVGYPDQFALWWDGVTCELGCTSSYAVHVDEIVKRLVASNDFRVV